MMKTTLSSIEKRENYKRRKREKEERIHRKKEKEEKDLQKKMEKENNKRKILNCQTHEIKPQDYKNFVKQVKK